MTYQINPQLHPSTRAPNPVDSSNTDAICLTKLPIEILLKIFKRLDFSGLLSMGSVSKKMCLLVNDNLLWKVFADKLDIPYRIDRENDFKSLVRNKLISLKNWLCMRPWYTFDINRAYIPTDIPYLIPPFLFRERLFAEMIRGPGDEIKFFSDEIKNNKKFFIESIKEHPWMLHHANEKVQKDPEMQAVMNQYWPGPSFWEKYNLLIVPFTVTTLVFGFAYIKNGKL